MARQPKDLKRKIASLSALGAGAFIAGAGSADASVIYSGPVNVDVGVSGTAFSTIPLTGSKTFLSFVRSSSTTAVARTDRLHYRSVFGRAAAAQFATTGGVGHDLRLFSPGAVFSGVARATAFVGSRVWKQTVDGGHRSSAVFGLEPFSNEYSLFRFTTPAGQTDYGWIQLSYSVGIRVGNTPGFGPDLTITGYAWDNSGALLPAGDIGAPEPGTMAMTGLGALALGAAGLRRWRKSRSAA